MADGIIRVPVDDAGKKVDTSELTVGANTVERQRVVVSDPTNASNLATVNAAGQSQTTAIPNDGTNSITTLFDLDTGAGTENQLGVSLRKAASGGSVEAGTSSNPLRTDTTGTTVQPVSAASLPLPSGASTLAKQPALGTAGAASADVISIQGIAGMTKVLVTPDSVALPANQSVNVNQVGGAALGEGQATMAASIPVVIASNQTPVGTSDAADGATAAAVPSSAVYVGANKSGNLVGLTTDASGNLNMNLAAGTISGGNAAAGATNAAVPSSADYTGYNSGGELVGVSATTPLPVSVAGSDTVAPRTIHTDPSGNMILSPSCDVTTLLYQIVLEIRALKFTMTALTNGQQTNMSDVEASNFEGQNLN